MSTYADLTPAERAYLDAGHAYCAARREAFDRAMEGTRADYEARSAEVNRCTWAMLDSVLALAPRSPRDNGQPVKLQAVPR